jgi:pimeloyl-[acyl-carrier protein] methyl ester esterase
MIRLRGDGPEVAGAAMAREVGCGAPEVVLLHGWAFHGGVWQPLEERLAAGNRSVSAPDLPGHGASPLDAPFELDAVVEGMGRVAGGPAVWVGWSLGALVALRLALLHPQRVRALVLIAATPCFVVRPDWPHGVRAEVLEAFAAGLAADWRATLVRFLALQARGGDGQVLRRMRPMLLARPPRPEALAGGLAVLRDTDLRGELGRVRCPALVIAGGRDTLVPVAAARALAGGLPNGRLVEVPQAGHAPFLTHPERVAGAIAEFLDTTDAASHA